ncbi:MAG: hypothetical protein PHY93_15655 [Bacteriovorax sp.]|nr:hypothetical protein [Bacteriovorax sp.]
MGLLFKRLSSLFCLLFLLTITLPAFATQYYPLNCRGGAPASMGFQIFPNGQNQLFVGFKGGTKPSSQGLAPGECSWSDRGFRPSEPTNLCVLNVQDLVLSSTSTGVSSCIPKPILQLFIHWSKSAPWMEKIRDESNYFTVNVTSDGAHCMIVNP